jgi:hypothetical protein
MLNSVEERRVRKSSGVTLYSETLAEQFVSAFSNSNATDETAIPDYGLGMLTANER